MKPELLNLLSAAMVTGAILRLTGAVAGVSAAIRKLGDTVASLAQSRQNGAADEDSGPQADVQEGNRIQ